MDAQERKDGLTEARKLLERAKDLFIGLRENVLTWDTNSLLMDVDDAIRTADYEVLRENKEEEDALTKAFFRDSMEALGRL